MCRVVARIWGLEEGNISTSVDLSYFCRLNEAEERIQRIRHTAKTERLKSDLVIRVTVLQESLLYGGHLLARTITRAKRSDGSRIFHIRLDRSLRRRLRLVVADEDTFLQEWIARIAEKTASEKRPKAAKEGK